MRKNNKDKQCNCDSCKEMRTLDRIDRVSRWVLGTVKWTYDFGYIMGSGALSNKNHPLENFKNLENDEKKYLINNCEKAYKPFKKYLLFYICYLFGAYFQQCKRHEIEFKFEKDFLMIQLKSFRKMIETFYNSPNKKALFPPLKNEQLELIVDWFIDYKENQIVENIFYSAAHYFHMEIDENSSFYKTKAEAKGIDAHLFTLTKKDLKGFNKSILQTEIPIRYSFVYLALTTHEKLKKLFIEYEANDDLIKKIISIGPDINYQIEPLKN